MKVEESKESQTNVSAFPMFPLKKCHLLASPLSAAMALSGRSAIGWGCWQKAEQFCGRRRPFCDQGLGIAASPVNAYRLLLSSQAPAGMMLQL
jgi:hypothetical protein